QALLEMACAGALSAGFPAQGIKADFTNPTHLQALAADPEAPPRLLLLIGNTLGAFDPIAEARDLSGLLRRGDALLVDGEGYAGDATVAGYDNPLNRRFAWAPLNAVGIREGDGELVFAAAGDARLPGLHLIPKYFQAGRDVEALMGGEALRLARGEQLAMNHSYKYAPETFLGILSAAGLTVRWQATSDDQRLLEPTAGEVRIAGERARDVPPTRLRRRIGYVIQEVGLFPHFTVARNVGLVPRLEGWDPARIAARVRELLAVVGLDPDTYAPRRPHQLSGGQRQRVGVARALAADPPLLLLDEPFGALDPITRVELQREFQALQQRLGQAMVFVTHDVREGLMLATRIGLMQHGGLAFLGTPQEFRESEHPECKAFMAAA